MEELREQIAQEKARQIRLGPIVVPRAGSLIKTWSSVISVRGGPFG